MHRLVEAVKTRLKCGRGAVACSGGADSVALVRAFQELNVPVTVAHVNHQLRGAESDEDEVFVLELAKAMQLPARSVQLPVPPGNLEAEARRLRYDWFASLGFDWIATAHTADDQAETVLHRMMRGAGLQGFRGILASPTMATGGLLERPLLIVTRSEVLSYLSSLNQRFRSDSSNAESRFTRNRIRHELLPLLKTFNPEIVKVLNHVAEQASDTFDYLTGEAEQTLKLIEKPRAGDVLIFDVAAMTSVEPVLVREALRVTWRREGWPMDGMSYEHWRKLANLEPGDYPGAVRLTVKGRVAQLRAIAAGPHQCPPNA